MSEKPYRILVLDGGGSKGVYTIGVLKELELKLGSPLCKHFDLIYGTSTGSIIAALLGLEYTIKQIQELYFELIPKIMRPLFPAGKSKVLAAEADRVFGDRKFDAFTSCHIGIVAMNYDKQIPFIPKTDVQLAHGLKSSFVPGFGLTISQAVQASCSAYPLFNSITVDTVNQGAVRAIDGGFVANNATLYAVVDAYKAIGHKEENIRVLSVGVGKYIDKPINSLVGFLARFNFMKFIDRIISTNSTTNEQLSSLLFRDLKMVRVSDMFNQPEYGTNMVETNPEKLKILMQLGRGSYAKYESEIDQLFFP